MWYRDVKLAAKISLILYFFNDRVLVKSFDIEHPLYYFHSLRNELY